MLIDKFDKMVSELRELGYVRTIGWFTITEDQFKTLIDISASAMFYSILTMMRIHDDPDHAFWYPIQGRNISPFGYMLTIAKNLTPAQSDRVLKFLEKRLGVKSRTKTKSASRVKTQKKKIYRANHEPSVMQIFGR